MATVPRDKLWKTLEDLIEKGDLGELDTALAWIAHRIPFHYYISILLNLS